MKAISVKFVKINDEGKRVVNAFIEADTTPATLPTTGAGIEGIV